MSPNLLLVGFQKCGSSYLSSVLLSSKEIGGYYKKETYALVDDTYSLFREDVNIQNPNFTWESLITENGITEGIKYRIESTVCNYYQKTAMTYALKNDVKVIFITRDPLERIKSIYKYWHGRPNGIDPECTFQMFFEKVYSERELYRDNEMLFWALEHTHYDKYIEKWQSSLGKDKVLVTSLELLINHAKCELSNISNFLELSSMLEPISGVVNLSKSPRFPLVNMWLINKFGGVLTDKSLLRKFYSKIGYKKTTIQLDMELVKTIVAIYSDQYKTYGQRFKWKNMNLVI